MVPKAESGWIAKLKTEIMDFRKYQSSLNCSAFWTFAF